MNFHIKYKYHSNNLSRILMVNFSKGFIIVYSLPVTVWISKIHHHDDLLLQNNSMFC